MSLSFYLLMVIVGNFLQIHGTKFMKWEREETSVIRRTDVRYLSVFVSSACNVCNSTCICMRCTHTHICAIDILWRVYAHAMIYMCDACHACANQIKSNQMTAEAQMKNGVRNISIDDERRSIIRRRRKNISVLIGLLMAWCVQTSLASEFDNANCYSHHSFFQCSHKTVFGPQSSSISFSMRMIIVSNWYYGCYKSHLYFQIQIYKCSVPLISDEYAKPNTTTNVKYESSPHVYFSAAIVKNHPIEHNVFLVDGLRLRLSFRSARGECMQYFSFFRSDGVTITYLIIIFFIFHQIHFAIVH